jgi:hypothetical protein
VAVKTNGEIKPFQLFIDGLKNTFKDATASVGNIKLNSTNNASENTAEKMVPLTVINN